MLGHSAGLMVGPKVGPKVAGIEAVAPRGAGVFVHPEWSRPRHL